MDELTLKVLGRHITGSSRVAVIRKEKGKFCVRSPYNPDWNGGCYDTEDEAKKRLHEVEYFKINKSAFLKAAKKGISFDKLRSMSKKELTDLGFGLWDEKGGEALMLFPSEMYDQIPEGFEVDAILGETEEFHKGVSDDDTRANSLPYGITVRVARRHFQASLATQLQSKMESFLEGQLGVKEGKELASWLESTFHFQGAKTPRGGKGLKEDLSKLHWFLANGLSQQQDPEKLRPTIEGVWDQLKGSVSAIVKLFSDEGGSVVPKEVKVGSNTYLNLSGFSEGQIQEYVKALEQVFDELKGWRKKALAGGLKIALAGPSLFRGTSSGKYKSSEDTLLVRATPKILKRTKGTYGAFDYIIVHELGHRYDYKRHPKEDFDKARWWTTPYSKKEGESFAELFAISNFGLTGSWDQSIVDRFEDFMATGKIEEREPVELPDHLKNLRSL